MKETLSRIPCLLWLLVCRAVALVAAILLIGSCRQAPSGDSNGASNPLFVDPNSVDFSENPALLARIRASPHGYLRFINIQFSQYVCAIYESALAQYPDFNLHGDAHVEQYAVTDLGRGLTDFDDSSAGPALVDLTRFAVSLELATQANGWDEEYDRLFERFIAGYRAALLDPQTEAPNPAVATRLAASFDYDRERYFEWIDEIVEPIPIEEERGLRLALEVYIEDILAREPELEAAFFEVQQVGSLKLGIGSALDRKYLVQIAGETSSQADDVILELKTVRDLTGIDCISTGQSDDPYRILIGQSIAYQPYSLLGYLRFDGDTFWIHAWVDNYEEMSIASDIKSADELAEIAYDVGVQLGRGHPNQLRPPLDIQLRREQVRLLERDHDLIRKTTSELTAAVNAAWKLFNATE